ncbi:MAG TPA: aldo/keto reductase [Spirochaetia bacterium]|nr:aldo/keto reductase [Spirochaetia bacterium]
MEKRRLGSSGLEVTLVGLGCNNFGGRTDFEQTQKVVHKTLDLGINLFDTADVYSRGTSEEFLGRILGDRRKEIVLATKVAKPMDDAGLLRGSSRRYIMTAVEASLKRLHTDWIDLYQLHDPDPHTPIEETMRTLDDIVRQGKVRYIGCSNFAAWQVVEAQLTAKSSGWTALISFQDDYNLLTRGIEQELVPVGVKYGMGLLPYYPLASGLLTGKYRKGEALPAGARITNSKAYTERYLTGENWEIVERLEAFASGRGHSLLELAFSWLACKASVASIIAGATKPEQVEQNAQAAAWVLSEEEMAEVDAITQRA